jgi:streptomycin 3"-adenylyltransferase
VDQVEIAVRLVVDVVRQDLVGCYLHGSSVLGGLRPASDVDILAVSRRSLDDRQRQTLVRALMAISGSPVFARPIELTVVVQSEVRPWRWPPTGDFLYGEWLRGDYEAGVIPAPEPMPDLALAVAITLLGDRSLAGPPPAEVLDPVPTRDLRRAGVAGIPALLEDLPGDTRNVVLTLARIWSTLATGTIRSKDAAAAWALPHLAPRFRPVLDHARHLYLTQTYQDETWPDELRAQVRPHVDEVLAHIERLASDVDRGAASWWTAGEP